eukprot:14803824-Alexandrium_andersonii.AAC.1
MRPCALPAHARHMRLAAAETPAAPPSRPRTAPTGPPEPSLGHPPAETGTAAGSTGTARPAELCPALQWCGPFGLM